MKAFPHPSLTISDMGQFRAYTVCEGGMDLRDYFAAKAMAAIIIYDESDFHLDSLAKESYRVADAMMEVRNEQVR